MKNILLKTFLRHAAMASAWLLAVLCVVERLAPGSVLAYIDLNWLALAVLALICLAPPDPARSRWRWFAWIPVALALLAFLALAAAETGESGRLFVIVAALAAVAFFIGIAYREKTRYD